MAYVETPPATPASATEASTTADEAAARAERSPNYERVGAILVRVALRLVTSAHDNQGGDPC